jgi:hypothetical protein
LVPALQFEPEIRLSEAASATLTDEQKAKFVAACPRDVFKIDADSNAVRSLGLSFRLLSLSSL